MGVRPRPHRQGIYYPKKEEEKKKGFSLAIWEGRFVDFHFTKHGSRLNLSTRPKLLFRYSVTAITPRSHRGDPGSTPGIGAQKKKLNSPYLIFLFFRDFSFSSANFKN